MKQLTLYLLLILLLCVCTNAVISQQPALYSCIPCGSNCDKDTYSRPGKCSHCNMDLVLQSTIQIKHIQPNEICSYIKSHPEVILLDVRTKEEYEGKASPYFGTLKNAINIPIQQLKEKMSSIEHLKNKEIIVYCSHSHRSPQASYILTQQGFTNITNMDGGMSKVKDKSCKK